MKKIIIYDFGSQYSQIIARKIRQLNVYCEVWHYQRSINEINLNNCYGIIFSGGPNSVYTKNAPLVAKNIFNLNIPILGICYGLQLICHLLDGRVKKASKAEFGLNNLVIKKDNLLTANLNNLQVWMSHGDEIDLLPKNFEILAESNHAIAIIKHLTQPIYGVQFHPETSHTLAGEMILENFIFQICKAEKNWVPKDWISKQTLELKKQVKNEKIILALSGGVDSTVTAVFLHQIFREQLHCVFVDTGLLPLHSGWVDLLNLQKQFGLQIIKIDAQSEFLDSLKNVTEPEKKRKIIGKLFINIFENYAQKHQEMKWLAQGTIYSDVIESGADNVLNATIKSHHNVGGLPKQMHLKLLEPMRTLFKDEVKKVGTLLDISDNFLNKHPIPGPGLAIRILGALNQEKITILQKADLLFVNALKEHKIYQKVAQAFIILLPIKTVGVAGDVRTYGYVAAIRCVNTVDFMTANWSYLPYDFLSNIATEIVNQIPEITRVVYDITNKPPGTIEWE